MELTPQRAREIILAGKADLERRCDGYAINYSGTSNEETNREHYQRLCNLLSAKGKKSDPAMVLASGAGYGPFYLRAFGFKGKIKAEELDFNSHIIANFLACYMNDQEVSQTFLKKGLKAAFDKALKKARQGQPLKQIDRLSFLMRDVTIGEENEQPYGVIVCDNIHNPQFLGQQGADNLSIRLCSLSQKGTILSYRCGTELEKIMRIGFRPCGDFTYERVS